MRAARRRLTMALGGLLLGAATIGLRAAAQPGQPILFAVDGFKAYVTCIRQVFRDPVHTGKRGRPPLVVWDDLHIVQVVKHRVGRRLVLTETGRLAFRYADEIFTLGREFMDTLKGRPTGQPLRFRVGVADVLPNLIAQRLLEPAFQISQPLRVMCHEGKTDSLLAQLILHELDLVLTDSSAGSGIKVKAFNHLLGECGLSIFASAKLASRYRRHFPRSLDGDLQVIFARHAAAHAAGAEPVTAENDAS